jgi:hypothetical protein
VSRMLQNLRKTFLVAHARADLGPVAKHLAFHAEDDGTRYLFPPYIPFVGRQYHDGRILVYAKAQNLGNSPDHRRWLREAGDNAVDRLYLHGERTTWFDIPIRPVEAGVLPALVGLYLFAERGLLLPSLERATEHGAFTNFYKYSLWRAPGTIRNAANYADLNPDRLSSDSLLEWYTQLNLDSFVAAEIDVLRPAAVITLKGLFADYLQDHLSRQHPKCRLLVINDPAWILRGGGGCLGTRGSWRRERIPDRRVAGLIDGYCQQIKDDGEAKYRGRAAEIRPYLAHYYTEFAEQCAGVRREERDIDG